MPMGSVGAGRGAENGKGVIIDRGGEWVVPWERGGEAPKMT